MRIVAAFLFVVVVAGFGCSHRRAPAAPQTHFSSVPGLEVAPAPQPGSAPSPAPLEVVPFGAPTAPVPAPAENSAGPASAPASPAPTNQKLIVTPEQGYIGKIAKVNDAARFVIVTFPIGHVPPVDQSLNVYRQGLKVGEVKVTEPQHDEFTAADIVTGDSAVGDEVRDK